MQNQQQIQKPLAVLRLKQVMAKIGCSSASSVYAKLDPGSSSFDPHFPKQIKLGASSVGWLEHELEDWILLRVKLSRA